MKQDRVPKLSWLSYDAIKLKKSINKPNVPCDIRRFQKDIKRGLSGAIKKRDLNLIKYALWKFKKGKKEHCSTSVYINAIETGNLEFVKFIFNNIPLKKGFMSYSNDLIIRCSMPFITLDIFKYVCKYAYFFHTRLFLVDTIHHSRIDIFEYIITINKEKSYEYLPNYKSFFHIACRNCQIDMAKHIYDNYLKDDDISEKIMVIKDDLKYKRSKAYLEVRKFLNQLENPDPDSVPDHQLIQT